MADTPYNTQVDRLPIGIRRSSVADTEPEDQSNDDSVESERGERYRKKMRRQRAIAQNIGRLMGGSKQRNLKAALESGGVSEVDSNKLDKTDIGILVGTSLLFDGLSAVICLLDLLIPFLGTVIERVTIFPLATLTMYIMYKKRNINFSAKIIVRFWGTRIIGFIPYIAFLPEYTLATVLVVMTVIAEQLTGLKKVIEENPEIMKYLEKYLK